MTELKPCPFCGEPAVIEEDAEDKGIYYVGCLSGGCFGRLESSIDVFGRSVAIAIWNHRYTPKRKNDEFTVEVKK